VSIDVIFHLEIKYQTDSTVINSDFWEYADYGRKLVRIEDCVFVAFATGDGNYFKIDTVGELENPILDVGLLGVTYSIEIRPPLVKFVGRVLRDVSNDSIDEIRKVITEGRYFFSDWETPPSGERFFF